jgi:hypothetical protein
VVRVGSVAHRLSVHHLIALIAQDQVGRHGGGRGTAAARSPVPPLSVSLSRLASPIRARRWRDAIDVGIGCGARRLHQPSSRLRPGPPWMSLPACRRITRAQSRSTMPLVMTAGALTVIERGGGGSTANSIAWRRTLATGCGLAFGRDLAASLQLLWSLWWCPVDDGAER